MLTRRHPAALNPALQPPRLSTIVARAALLLAAGAPAVCTPGQAAEEASHTVFDGYDAFYLTLPDRIFGLEHMQTYTDRGPAQRVGDFWTWRLKGRAHVLELRGADVRIDGRHHAAASAVRFLDDGPAPALGRSARVFANDEAVCIEGVPSSASGSGVRYHSVTLVLRPYRRDAQRIELPGLFASCLTLTRKAGGAIGLLRGSFRWDPETALPHGIDFQQHMLKDGKLTRRDQARSITFVEPGNVYRFVVR